MKLVLHVGPHKTATTWLQANFHANRKALRARGWYYPATGERVRIAHHDLSDRPGEITRPESRLVAELARIGKTARADGLDVLLSSEGFGKWSPRHILALKKAIGADRLVIVHALRDPVSQRQSFWAQKVKSGVALNLPAFLKRRAAKRHTVGVMKTLAGYRAIADGGVVVLAYDEIVRRGLDIHDVFLQSALGITDLPANPEAATNPREPLELTEFIRLINRRNGRQPARNRISIGRAMRYLLTETTRRRIVETVSAVEAARRELVIDRDRPGYRRLEKRLLKTWRESMAPAPEGALFPQGPARLVWYDESVLEADPAVAALLADIARQLHPSGLRVRFIDWINLWLMRWRRLFKRLGLRR